jgi:hypothetical protein
MYTNFIKAQIYQILQITLQIKKIHFRAIKMIIINRIYQILQITWQQKKEHIKL